MTGCDHHAAGAFQFSHCKGEKRGGNRSWKKQHLCSKTGKNTGGKLGKGLGMDAGVPADGHLSLMLVKMAGKITGNPPGGLGDGIDVDPVGSRTHGTAKPSSAKGKIPIKAVLNLLGMAAHLREGFGRVGIPCVLTPAQVFCLAISGFHGVFLLPFPCQHWIFSSSPCP